MKPIDLAKKPFDEPGMPVNPTPLSSGEPRYPWAHLDDFPGPELADSGTITFRYRVDSKEEIPAKNGKPERCHYRLELLEVTKATLEDEAPDADESAEQAMDRKLRRK